MIKKIVFWHIIFIALIFSLGADAALQWKVGAFIGTFAGGVALAIGLAGAASIVVAGTLAVGVHAAVIGLYWDDLNPPQVGGQSASLGLSVVIDANTPFVTPPGWTAAMIGTQEPEPPDPISVTTDWVVNVVTFAQSNNGQSNIQHFSTYADALTALQSVYSIATTNDTNPYNVTFTGHQLDKPAPQTDNDGQSISGTNSCPTGYIIDNNGGGTDCLLDNPALVQKPSDDVCEVSVAGGTFNASSNDPDCANTAVIGLGTSSLTAATPNKAVYMATSASGGVTVYEKTYTAGTNTTSLSTANFNPSSDLDFIQTANSLGNNVAINPVGGGTGTGTGDAKDASLNVVAGGDENIGVGSSATGGVIAPSDTLGTSFNPLRNWAVPTGTGTCPTGTFNAFNQSFTLDGHCALFEANMPVIRQAFGVVFSVSALFIVLGA